MLSLEELKSIIGEILQIPGQINKMGPQDVLLGGIPEFDSMAVVSILTTLEENHGIAIDDDEISAEAFETLGSLLDFVNARQS